MTEVEQLKQYLAENDLHIGGITLGNDPKNAETVARELRLSLEALARGEGEEITFED